MGKKTQRTGPRLSDVARRGERGAALATALIFLVIITLLGLAAMRVGQINLRLALNEESRVTALESAQSLLDSVLNNNTTAFTIQSGSDYVQSCFLGSSVTAAMLPIAQATFCPSAKIVSSLPPDDAELKKYGYVSIYREQIGGSDFAPVAALRKGDSGERFRLARFTVTAGYDHTAENMSVAEVVQGTYIKIDTVDGITMQ